MGAYEYITKGVCDINPDQDAPEEYVKKLIPYVPNVDDMQEKINEAKATGQPIEIKMDIIAHFWDFFERNKDKQYLVLYGGSGGGKSHSVDQYLINKMFTEKNCKIAMYRKSGTSLRASIMDMVIGILTESGYRENIDYTYNRTNRIITAIQSGGTIHFKSLDNPEKIKSTAYNYVNLEELTEFTLADFLMCANTLRKESECGALNQMFVTWNPVGNSWCYDFFDSVVRDPVESKKYAFNHSTYINNPKLPKSYVEKLEQSYKYDRAWFMCYALGRRGQTKDIIFTNWNIIPNDKFNDIREPLVGIDWGYQNPCGGIEMYQDPEDRHEIYVREIMFQSHLTMSDIIEYLNTHHPDIKKYGYEVICDSAEPDRIESMCQAGYSAVPANKNVKAGINKMMQYHFNITESSENLIREMKSYCWVTDSKTGDMLDIPRKIDDHLVDALRYAVNTQMISECLPDVDDYITEDDVFYV